ncbi:MAG: FHA domain-containing protein [Pseudomonadota bacterium]
MRFIRDIIDEKKSEALPNTPQGFDAGFGAEFGGGLVDQDAGPAAISSPPQDITPVPSATLAQTPSDEQALRNIFKTELDKGPTTLPDAEQADLQAENPEPEHPHGSAGTAQSPSEHLEDARDEPEQHLTDPYQPPDLTRVEPIVHTEADITPPVQPTAFAEPDGPPQPVEVPQPAAGRMLGRSGRVKTRVLGFGQPQQAQNNVFDRTETQAPSMPTTHPVGWLVVVKGPGTGSAFTLFSGVSSIGRGPDQTVALAFGDNSISRENHAAIAYDAEQRSFFLGHGGKTNLVRLNNRPVLSTEELRSDDQIRIGETTLRFVALCGAKFSWSTDHVNGVAHDAAQ